MYAVIASGGKQYKVAIGDRLKVESLDLDPGASVDLESVLFLSDGEDIKAGSPYLNSVVRATVIGHGRGEKIRIFKMRKRKNSRQRTGHRQNFTELEIVSIDGKAVEPAAKSVTEKAAAPEVEDVKSDDDREQVVGTDGDTSAAEDVSEAVESAKGDFAADTDEKTDEKTT